MFLNSFFLNIKGIQLAHEYILDRVHRCEYQISRGHYGLVYVLSGCAQYRFYSGERIYVSDGDVLFLAQNATYSIVTEKEFRHYTVNFDIHEQTSKFGALNKEYCFLKESGADRIKRCFARLTSIWTLKKTSFEMKAVGCLYELLSIFYFEYINGQNTAPYQRLLPAKEYIEQSFDKPITLDELARISNMSVTNFRREWKKVYSDAPLQYRDSIRLYYAKEYLNSGYYNVSEIAQKCGFDDVSYFIRFFKKQTGISPGKFKKQY